MTFTKTARSILEVYTMYEATKDYTAIWIGDKFKW